MDNLNTVVLILTFLTLMGLWFVPINVSLKALNHYAFKSKLSESIEMWALLVTMLITTLNYFAINNAVIDIKHELYKRLFPATIDYKPDIVIEGFYSGNLTATSFSQYDDSFLPTGAYTAEIKPLKSDQYLIELLHIEQHKMAVIKFTVLGTVVNFDSPKLGTAVLNTDNGFTTFLSTPQNPVSFKFSK